MRRKADALVDEVCGPLDTDKFDIESTRGADGLGITVSYWDSLDAVRRWGEHVEHRLAQQLGRDRWYEAFRLRVCRVEAERVFERET